MSLHNILPEYCIHGYMVGQVATHLHYNLPEVTEWFINRHNHHQALFGDGYPTMTIMNSMLQYVLSHLSLQTGLDTRVERYVLGCSNEVALEQWLAIFDTYIMPILKTHTVQIFEVN